MSRSSPLPARIWAFHTEWVREDINLFDCSGLVYRIFEQTGQLERVGGARLRAAGYMRWFMGRGRAITNEEFAERGDLVVYNNG